MSQQKLKLTRHHIMAKSNGGSNAPENIKMLKWRTHEALHTLFENKTPRDQIITLVSGINATALTREFKNDIMRILQETDDQYYYKKGILLPYNKKTL